MIIPVHVHLTTLDTCVKVRTSPVWLFMLMHTLKLLYPKVGDADAETYNTSAVVAGTIVSVVVVVIITLFVSIIATVVILNARKRKTRSELL